MQDPRRSFAARNSVAKAGTRARRLLTLLARAHDGLVLNTEVTGGTEGREEPGPCQALVPSRRTSGVHRHQVIFSVSSVTSVFEIWGNQSRTSSRGARWEKVVAEIIRWESSPERDAAGAVGGLSRSRRGS